MPKRRDQPRYYRVRRGRAFWEPGQWAVPLGLPASRALGPDGPDAKAAAIHLNAKLDAARSEDACTPKPKYPPGSLGAFYLLFQQSEAWGQMEAATQEDYHRCWPVIEARFAGSLISKLTPEVSERFHVDIHPAHANKRDADGKLKLPWNTAHRVLKVWRALLTALVAYRLINPPAPIGRVSNPKPRGRGDVAHLWLAHEVDALIDEAVAQGKDGLAVAIAIAWDTMVSPVDVRTLPIGAWRRTAEGGDITTTRAKTGAAVYSAVTAATAERIERYLAQLRAAGADVSPEAWLVRSAKGRVYAVRHTMSADFRDVREKAFPGDRRQLLDLRRSGATEGYAGGAEKHDLGASMSNTLANDPKLQSTYVLAASTKVLAHRAAGRGKLAAKFRKDAE